MSRMLLSIVAAVIYALTTAHVFAYGSSMAPPPAPAATPEPVATPDSPPKPKPHRAKVHKKSAT